MSVSFIELDATELADCHQDCACLDYNGTRKALTLAKGSLEGWLLTPVLPAPAPFQRAVPSWNIAQPEGSSLTVEFRARTIQGEWSPWHSNHKAEGAEILQRGFKWEIDQLFSKVSCNAIQLRLRLQRESEKIASPRVYALCSTQSSMGAGEARLPADRPEPVAPITVPFIYQHTLDNLIGGQICSPTSVAMVLRSMGLDASPLEVARLAYHPEHKIYGGWPQAVHAAFQYGASGSVRFMSNWRGACEILRRGVPMVASIRFAEGALKNPPYAMTDGHLLVLNGIDPDGSPVTCDPNLPEERGSGLRWDLEDFAKAWFGAGGVSYVFSRAKHISD